MLFPLENSHVQSDQIVWNFGGHFLENIVRLIAQQNSTDYFIETRAWLDRSEIESFTISTNISNNFIIGKVLDFRTCHEFAVSFVTLIFCCKESHQFTQRLFPLREDRKWTIGAHKVRLLSTLVQGMVGI
jgi:hypothetical protein